MFAGPWLLRTRVVGERERLLGVGSVFHRGGNGTGLECGLGSARATGVGERAMRSKSGGADFDEAAQRVGGGGGRDRGCCAVLERLEGALDEGKGCVEVIRVDEPRKSARNKVG